MNISMKCLKTLGIILGILHSGIAMGSLTMRHSVYYWTRLSVFVLPICYWRRYAFKYVVFAALAFGGMLALSPIDFGIRATGEFGLHLLPTSFGIAAEPGTYSYGCIVPEYPALYAIVPSY